MGSYKLSEDAKVDLIRVPFWTARDLENKLYGFKDFYNDQRCHYALDGGTPGEDAAKTCVHPINSSALISLEFSYEPLPCAIGSSIIHFE